MQRAYALRIGLAAAVVLPGCRTQVTVLSSVDAGVPDGGGSSRTDTGSDAGMEDATAMVRDGAGASTDDGSNEGVGSTCDVCSGGTTCQNGQCVCPSGLTLCAGTCVDEQADNGNCGGCANACSSQPPSTAACTAGRCIMTLFVGASGVGGVVVDATSVYLTEVNPGGGEVIQVSTVDGTPTVLAESTQSAFFFPEAVATDTTGIYWADYGAPASVMALLSGASAVTTLASGQDGPSNIALDATSVYWMNLGSTPSVSDGSTVSDGASVMKVAKSGGIPTTLASAQSVGDSPGFAVDATSVYWTTVDSVLKVSADGGTPTVLASAQNFPEGYSSIAVDATSVYWTTATSIMKIASGGGAAVTLASVPAITPSEIALDATTVYWTYLSTDSNGGVMKVDKDGGTPTIVTSIPYSPDYYQPQTMLGPLAVDATSIYATIFLSGAPSASPSGFALVKVTPK